MTRNVGYHATRCPRVEEWPPLHRQAWRAAFRKGGLFDDPGRARNWRPATIEKTRKGYGAWLDWRFGHGGADAASIDASRPDDPVSPSAVRAYVDHLAQFRSSMTVYNRIQELYDSIRVMAPDRDWTWLKAAMDILRGEARPSRNKLARLKEASRIEELGLTLMAKAEAAPKRDYRAGLGMTELQRALAYRDGLIIALLIRRPFRIKNFDSLTIGDNFIIDNRTASFAFKATEMKGKRPIDVPFPSHLMPNLRRYVEHYRNVLLYASAKSSARPTNALWISRDGTPLAIACMHNAIRRRTRAAFGAPLPPHWFRDAAVTFLVRDKPASARITGAILGHSTPDIATRHYNQALMVDAGRRHAAVIEAMMAASDAASSDSAAALTAPQCEPLAI